MLILLQLTKIMKSLKVFSFTGHLIRKLGLTKLYYWFNK